MEARYARVPVRAKKFSIIIRVGEGGIHSLILIVVLVVVVAVVVAAVITSVIVSDDVCSDHGGTLVLVVVTALILGPRFCPDRLAFNPADFPTPSRVC